MIKRWIYRAQVKPNYMKKFVDYVEWDFKQVEKLIGTKELLAMTVHRYKSNIFIYYETTNTDYTPDFLLANSSMCLMDWPGEASERKWVRMYDIFHYVADQEPEHWIRKRPDHSPVLRVIKLKPEMVASYIFLHYQLQEELEGKRHKYGMIGINENLLAMYTEEPNIEEDPKTKGLLNTKNSPPGWGDLMQQHFIPLEDVQNWYQIENIKYLYAVE